VTGLAAQKAAARTAAFARRKAAHGAVDAAAAREALDTALRDHRGAVLAGYMPLHSEIDPRPVMVRWAETGRVCVPVVAGKGLPLAFHAWTAHSRMLPGAFGALIPETADIVVPEVLIVPLVAFDRSGYRLGYGGGFYDRTLADLRAASGATAIGFAYAAQEMPRVPREATDQPLDAVVTETEVISPR